MKKSRYSESQIVRILKAVEGGRLIKEVCREYGISDATYYNWKSKYGGLEASDVKRLKELEEENRHLKQMYAELSLDHKLLKDVIEKSSKDVGSAIIGGLPQAGSRFQYSPSLSSVTLCIATDRTRPEIHP